MPAVVASSPAARTRAHADVRRLVLFLVALCYLSSFASLHRQYRGLFGTNGVSPVDAFLDRVSFGAKGADPRPTPSWSTLRERVWTLPTLAWTHELSGGYARVDDVMEILLLVGAVLSAAAATTAARGSGSGGAAADAWVWAAMFAAYLSVFNVGQTFLSFQWDVLLLEVGFVCVLLAAAGRPGSETLPLWLLRFVAFKLMLMSGAVKIQADCPTWSNLTALRYHFATQPLPTPLAKAVADASSDLVSRLGVAVCLAVEGPIAFLLVAPFRGARAFAAVAQIAFQVAIALTGNYAFFNALTAALCASALDDDALKRLVFFWRRRAGGKEPDEKDDDELDFEALEKKVVMHHDDLPANVNDRRETLEVMFSPKKKKGAGGVSGGERFGGGGGAWPRRWDAAERALSPLLVAAAVVASVAMFRVDDRGDLTLAIGARETNRFLAVVVPVVVFGVWTLALPVSAASGLIARRRLRRSSTSSSSSSSSSRVAAIYEAIVAIVALVLATVVFAVLARPFASIVPGGGVERALPSFGGRVDDAARTTLSEKLRVGSGYGLFRRMTGVGDGDGRVARPELVVEGKWGDSGGGEWRAIEFRYKPGNVSEAPKFVAPHQPRLDWQMWFAALGHRAHHDPWLVHLVTKLLAGEPDVVKLLRTTSSLPTPPPPPKFIRVRKYEYAFSGDGGGRDVDVGTWWTRKHVGEYLSPLSLESKDLRAFVESHGWRWPVAAPGARTDARDDDASNVVRAALELANASPPIVVVAFAVAAGVSLALGLKWIAGGSTREERRRHGEEKAKTE